MEIETKINKWDLIKLENFCTVRETLKVERQFSELEKITANETTDKGLISKLYKELDFHLIQRRIPNRTIKIQNGMSGDLRVFPRLEMVLRVIKHQPDGK